MRASLGTQSIYSKYTFFPEGSLGCISVHDTGAVFPNTDMSSLGT